MLGGFQRAESCQISELEGNPQARTYLSPFVFKVHGVILLKETHDTICSTKLPELVKLYNIYGIDYDTPHIVWYLPIWIVRSFSFSFSFVHAETKKNPLITMIIGGMMG